MQKVIIFFVFVGVIRAYDLYSDLRDNCHIVSRPGDWYSSPAIEYNLGFNEDAYRVKELSIRVNNENRNVIHRRRFWPLNRRESMSMRDYQQSLIYEFIFVNESRVCYVAYFNPCAYHVQELPCEPLPAWNSPTIYCGADSMLIRDFSGHCIAAGSAAATACKELTVWNLFETVVTKPARVINGFRVNDCEGRVISEMPDNSITIRENNVDLQPPETKQQLIHVNNENKFIQLMISVCPRTAVAINALVAGLTEFINVVDLSNSFIALTVFDGGYDSVDLLHFTNDADLINATIANLTNYELRDDTCNVRQSIMKKFAETSAHIYGQPWDTLNFVIYTATGDLVNYVTDNDAVVIPINRRRDISTFVIGQNLPPSQERLFYYLGARGLFRTTDSTSTIQAFGEVASSIVVSSSGFKLLGYCSASRSGTAETKILYKFKDGTYPDPGSTLMELRYNASEFTPGCRAEHARDFCSPCTTVIDNRHILCYDCFNQSNAALQSGTKFAQVLLRIPSNGTNLLQLPTPNSSVSYSVYGRLGGLSNPLLYHFKFVNVSQRTVELPALSAGDLVGVFVDWNNFAYNASLGVKIVSGGTPPVAVPFSPPVTPPVAPPVTPPVTPPIMSPVAAPITAPVTPVSSPVGAPVTVEAPVNEPAVKSPFYAPIEAPFNAPLAPTPINSPVQINVPLGSPPVPEPIAQPIAIPTAQPIAQPVGVPIEQPIAAPVQAPSVGSSVAAPQTQTDDSVSGGVRIQLGFIVVLGTLFLAFF